MGSRDVLGSCFLSACIGELQIIAGRGLSKEGEREREREGGRERVRGEK